MARIMSEVLERPIAYHRVSPEEHRAALVGHGMSEAWAQGLLHMSAAVEAGAYAADLHRSRSASPTGFRQWCQDVLRPALAA